ncbi:MAG: Chromosome-partitioning ATPase Soj [Myxococcota bacterium]|nr:Chromosome-partitioning ATPase Soj [Myxococcota bacterium]
MRSNVQVNAVRRQSKIAIVNHKGGTGKTTSALNIAAGLAEKGYQTLLVDLDPQGAIGTSLGIQGEFQTSHLLRGERTVAECAVPIRDNLDVITTNERLYEEEAQLIRARNGAVVLRDRLLGDHHYHFMVMDCPPSLALLTENVLNAAEHAVIPVACDYLSLVAIKQTIANIEAVNRRLVRPVRIIGILPTFYDARTRVSQEAVRVLTQHFGEKVMTPIRVNTKLREAPSWRKTIYEYAADSHGAQDYLKAVEDLLLRCNM